MGNCDKKSTGNRKFTGKCSYILYFNGQFTVLLQIFCKFTGNWPYFTGFTVYSRKIFPGKCPVFSNYGAFPSSKFSGEYTVNPVKYDQPPVNLRKICKRTVNWPLIYKMYGHFPVNSRFPVLFLSQLPITLSVKLRLIFTVQGQICFPFIFHTLQRLKYKATFLCAILALVKDLTLYRPGHTNFWGQLIRGPPSLCWFQTNLPLAALPLRRLASLAVSELQLSAATPLWLFTERQSLLSWIEFNCLRSAAVGKAARLSIYWLDAACRLVIPLRQVTLAQLN